MGGFEPAAGTIKSLFVFFSNTTVFSLGLSWSKLLGCSGGGVNAMTLPWTLTETPPPKKTTTLAPHATRLLLETEKELGGRVR